MAHLNGTDPEWISDLIVDAYAVGEFAAAKKNGVSRSTITRAKRKMRDDAALRQLVDQKIKEVQHDLSTLRVKFLRDALAAATDKLPTATLYEVSGAIKIVGELHQVASMVDDESESPPDDDNEASAETDDEGKVITNAAGGSTDAHH